LVVVCTVAVAQGDGKKTPPVGPLVVTVTPEKVMTKAEAVQLFKSVDEIMTFAAKDTGLAPVVKVKRRLVTRDEVNRYLVKNFAEDESAKRLQRSEIVLKKFGLLNRDFDLRPFLLSLLTEQVAGFYDDKTKTVNMLNWVDMDEQKPVLAHELTHAIQDQKVGLTKWGDSGYKGISHTSGEDNSRVSSDEMETARQAVAEGQAMVVFVDWGIRDTGKTLADSPEIGQRMKEAAADSSGSPVMARAPFLLQRSLVFPYADGLAFEQALLISGGKSVAFAGALQNPPSSSFEIMHPEKYLAHAPVPALHLPDVHTLLDADYDPYDLGVMGELDVEIMASLFGGPEVAKIIAPAWNGGVYYAAQRKSATAAEKATPNSLGVFYFSKWKSAEAAQTFAKIYSAQLGRKYSGLSERKPDETSAEHVFTTHEGDVLVSVNDDTVFISEGFAVATARKLRDSSMDAQGTGPVRMAVGPELMLGTVRALSAFGAMKFGIAHRYTSGSTHSR
jgi:hypothetical protein